MDLAPAFSFYEGPDLHVTIPIQRMTFMTLEISSKLSAHGVGFRAAWSKLISAAAPPRCGEISQNIL
jgi:hypothetical protein